jgi:formylglycine-generating enzyme required for sulfatase activity
MFCIQRLKYVALFLLLALIIFGCGKDPEDPVFNNPNDPLSPNYVEKNNSTNTGTVKDDAPMVLIPAGEFQMGDSLDGMSLALPVHTVYLDAFYIDIYEVTNAQYKKFMDAKGYEAPYYWNDPNYNAPNNPVVGVSWNDAKAYADWVGKRLPTEAEWEKSARGGLVGKRYPWGDTLTRDDANYDGTGGKDVWITSSPVGSFAPNGYGLYDMAGNVYEWCADWYDDNYYANSPKSNPTGPSSGKYRVLRGGSWGNGGSALCVSSRRENARTTTGCFVGFRCVSGLSVTP